MGFRRAVLVALCASALACASDNPTAPELSPAPTPVPSPSPQPTPPFTLSGRVIDLDTAGPLASTSVAILDGPDAGRTAITDSSGTFEIGDLRNAGFTVRFRHEGYDSVFRGVTLVSDASLAIAMRLAMLSLSGTWTGSLTAVTPNTPSPQTESIPELNVTHTGAEIAGVYPNTVVLFSGTLRDPSGIGATTALTGVMTVTVFQSGRSFMTCKGSGAMSGTVNWTRLVIVAPQVLFDCGFTYTNATVSLIRQQ